MLPSQRQTKIIEMLNSDEVISFDSLATMLGVSTMTIRRDVAALTNIGKAEAVYGGVKLSGITSVTDQETCIKTFQQAAQLAVGEVNNIFSNKSIFLDSGLFGRAIAKCLIDQPDITFVTRDIDIAFYLNKHSRSSLILLGGHVSQLGHTDEYVSAEQLANLNIDYSFLQVRSLDESGLSDRLFESARFYSVLSSRSQNITLYINESGLARRDLYNCFSLVKCQKVIVNGCIKDDSLGKLKKSHSNLVILKV